MAVVFTKAVKSQAKGRVGLIGPSGSGKTYTALLLAKHMGGRTALIDTEHGSASKYADEFDFETLILESFHPQNYIDAIKAAGEQGFDNLIIDSLTHAWSGTGGALELVDRAVAKSKSGNSYVAWREVTPLHNQLIEAMLSSSCHLIATMRSKMEYVQNKNESTGKTEIRKVGMAPIQREGMEYEFDVVGDLDIDHTLVISKTRCRVLDGQVIRKPGKELAVTLKAWLSDGAAPMLPPVPTQPAEQPKREQTSASPANSANTPKPAETPKPTGGEDEESLDWKTFWGIVRPLKLGKTSKEEQAFIYREASSFFGCGEITSLTQVPNLDNAMLQQFLEYLRTIAQKAS